MSTEQVKPGYKRTEVGVIPEDWECQALQELTNPERPIGYGIVQTGKSVAGGVRCIRVVDIIDKIDLNQLITTSKEISQSYKRTILQENDLIIALRGKIGAVAVIKKELEGANLTRGVALLSTSEKFHSGYVSQYLSSFVGKNAIEKNLNGSALQEIPIASLRKLPTVTPPLSEQRAIAATLSDADALLAQLDQLIAKKRDLKQAAMQQLLTGQTRLPGFSGEWEVKRMGEVASLHRINVVPADQPTDHFTHFSLPAFDEERSAVVELGSAIGSNKFRVPPDAILVSKLNPRIPRIWAPEVIPSNACASTEWLVLTPREGVERSFLFVVCASPQFCEQMELGATGTTGSHQRISPAAVLRLNVTIPVKQEEQTAIAAVLSDMDAELAALEARRDKTRALKQGMMQELLTGRIRLV